MGIASPDVCAVLASGRCGPRRILEASLKRLPVGDIAG